MHVYVHECTSVQALVHLLKTCVRGCLCISVLSVCVRVGCRRLNYMSICLEEIVPRDSERFQVSSSISEVSPQGLGREMFGTHRAIVDRY